MKKPRTGGAGLLRFHWGGTSDGEGNAITLLGLRLYRLSVSGILSHRRARELDGAVALKHWSIWLREAPVVDSSMRSGFLLRTALLGNAGSLPGVSTASV